MGYVMSVSPDIGPDRIAGWYIFNTWMQRQLHQPIHLELFSNFQQQRDAIKRNEIDLIYANPFDAAMLVREKGFTVIAAPSNIHDEAVIAVRADSAVESIESLPSECRAAVTDTPDINMIGKILLEPANITSSSLHLTQAETYITVVKLLLQNQADVGFFLADAYDSFSRIVKQQMRVLMRSQINDVRHVLLAQASLQSHYTQLRELLAGMPHDQKGSDALKSLGFSAWDILEQEDTEFMIDLIDTLLD